MGKPDLDPRIMNTMERWGGNYDSDVGCSHNGVADKKTDEIESKNVTLNIMSKMDASHAKPSSKNPGFDGGFWAKAKPQMDTVGEGLLTRKLKD